MNGLGWILRLEVKELSNNDVSSVVGDGTIDANNSLLEQTREDVVGALPSGGMLNHHRHEPIVSSAIAGNRSRRSSCNRGFAGTDFTP